MSAGFGRVDVKAQFVLFAVSATVGLFPGIAAAGAPTYVVEWTSRTGQASQRMTLFSDRVLVRKSTAADGKVEMKKRKLAAAEFDSYVSLFRSPEVADAAGGFESGMGGDGVARSVVTVAREDGTTWRLTFDSFSALSPSAARVRAAIEDLRDSFGRIRASSGDFPPEKLVPGAILKRRDGAEFRILRYDERAGVVEVRGLDAPYSQFFKIETLPATFLPP